MLDVAMRSALLSALALCSTGVAAQNTSQLSENGWFSDDTRADGLGSEPAGTNLISPTLTDDPEATASGTSAHDADIRRQITFGPAPGTVPAGTHRGALHLSIAPGAGAGKSQVSHRIDDGVGHVDGATAFGPGTTAEYSWMGDGTPTVTMSLKLGVKTADFGSTGVSSRTGENAWDKILIYEPGNLNGGTSDGTWQTETVDYTTGRWWFFDRTAGASIIGSPMTLSDMSTSGLVFSGSKTVADVYALITAPGAHVTSVQFGIGSGNAGGSVYVNQLETSFYRPGSTTTFGQPPLEYDQDVTPDVIFGSGNANGGFTTSRNAGVELGLRGKVRFPTPMNVFNSNGDGTYTFEAGAHTPSSPVTPLWAFEWSINTDDDGSSGDDLDDLTYELGLDFDPGPGVNYQTFDPISTAFVPFWDHAIGDNTTPNGGGTVAGDAPTYAGLVAANNVAQNSWRMDFFDDPPFDVFDPTVPGRYEFYLSASDGGSEVARTAITIIVERSLEYDQDVTNEVIFGSGNDNGAFTTDRNAGVELALRGKVRFPTPMNVFNSNGDGTYTFDAGAHLPSSPETPLWAFEWSANTDYDSSTGSDLDDFTYEMGLDFDPGSDTNYLVFDPISAPSTIPYTTPATVTYWDHAIGDNTTANGAGAVAGDAATYAGLVGGNNLAQNSWRMDFFDSPPFDVFDPTVPGRYEFYLAAFDGSGDEVARTNITIFVTDGPSLTLEADPCQDDQDPSKAGVQVAFDLWMRNLDSDVTGFQAFLAFDDSKLTYEGACSDYTATPFALHIQGLATAEVAPGELRVDGSVDVLDPPATDDALLATLVFTVAAECDPVSLAFDTTQAFDSELSFEGTPIATGLVDSSAIVPDATPPLVTVPADIAVTADAGVGSGCDSAVVTFTASALDTCSAVTLVCNPPSGTAFPAGQTTTVSCAATDDCGNVTISTFDVTVSSTNTVCLDVQLVGVATPTTRCIHFVMDDCGSTADVMLPFDATGFFSGEIEVPCGNWTMICAKDEQHTQWDTQTLSLSGDGTKYVADAVLDLEGGDTDNDGDVDINGVTLFLLQVGLPASPGGCPWDGTRDADFSNNGVVGTEDYSFLTANWLTISGCGCSLPSTHGGGGRRSLVFRSKVLPATAGADRNGDGWIDWRDVEIYERSVGLAPYLSTKIRAAAR